jgi:hypothetical protein
VADGATSRGPRSAPAASAFGGETGWGSIDRNQKLHRALKNGNKSAERRINFHFNILLFFSLVSKLHGIVQYRQIQVE